MKPSFHHRPPHVPRNRRKPDRNYFCYSLVLGELGVDRVPSESSFNSDGSQLEKHNKDHWRRTDPIWCGSKTLTLISIMDSSLGRKEGWMDGWAEKTNEWMFWYLNVFINNKILSWFYCEFCRRKLLITFYFIPVHYFLKLKHQFLFKSSVQLCDWSALCSSREVSLWVFSALGFQQPSLIWGRRLWNVDFTAVWAAALPVKRLLLLLCFIGNKAQIYGSADRRVFMKPEKEMQQLKLQREFSRYLVIFGDDFCPFLIQFQCRILIAIRSCRQRENKDKLQSRKTAYSP